jgi:hypothetical protein
MGGMVSVGYARSTIAEPTIRWPKVRHGHTDSCRTLCRRVLKLAGPYTFGDPARHDGQHLGGVGAADCCLP